MSKKVLNVALWAQFFIQYDECYTPTNNLFLITFFILLAPSCIFQNASSSSPETSNLVAFVLKGRNIRLCNNAAGEIGFYIDWRYVNVEWKTVKCLKKKSYFRFLHRANSRERCAIWSILTWDGLFPHFRPSTCRQLSIKNVEGRNHASMKTTQAGKRAESPQTVYSLTAPFIGFAGSNTPNK